MSKKKTTSTPLPPKPQKAPASMTTPRPIVQEPEDEPHQHEPDDDELLNSEAVETDLDAVHALPPSAPPADNDDVPTIKQTVLEQMRSQWHGGRPLK